jgi:hypothetical protein
MKEGDLPQLADKLNALAEYTIRFLKSIKGLEKYFQDPASITSA